MMTWNDLLEKLQQLTVAQLETNVTVLATRRDEYFQGDFTITVGDDVLNDDHPVIIIRD